MIGLEDRQRIAQDIGRSKAVQGLRGRWHRCADTVTLAGG